MNMKPHKHATYLRLLSLKESMWQASDILKVFREGVLSCVGKLAGVQYWTENAMSQKSPSRMGTATCVLQLRLRVGSGVHSLV